MEDIDMEFSKYFDHTILKPQATSTDVIKLCKEALAYNFASVCINSCYTSLVKQQLEGSSVKVCTVIGFPLGAMSTKSKMCETMDALEAGSDEIDMVINVGALKDKYYKYVEEEIRNIKNMCGVKTLKVIIETCLLTDEEKITACEISLKAGADYVKTSTGFMEGGATVHDVRLMKSIVGDEACVKASGGIRDYETAKSMIEAGANRLGTSATINIMKEYEASKN